MTGLTLGGYGSLIGVLGGWPITRYPHRSSLPTGSLLPRTPKSIQTCFGDYAAAAVILLFP